MKTISTNDELRECILNCEACHNSCLETMRYCLDKGGDHAKANHITLLQSCAEICKTAADLMVAGSDLHKTVCRACAEICEACAKDCEGFGNDKQMQKCAYMCRQCAESCMKMSTA